MFASGNNLLDVQDAEVYVLITLPHGWCGSFQRNAKKREAVISRFCRDMAVSNLPARIVEVRHG